jgi:FlaA1/EpsC-like NDP-sugar epimerase
MTVRSVDGLAEIAVGRTSNLFEPDLRAHSGELTAAVQGKSLLVVGGAGSIGKRTLKSLLHYRPAKLVVVDPDENGLAELVRDLRSSPINLDSIELHFEPLDALGGLGWQLLRDSDPFDICLNFAALKHVRSEKDWYSRLRMLELNVLLPYQLLQACEQKGVSVFFSVSTDKAAAPVNHLGATKRVMEMVMLDLPWVGVDVRTARFANVALSAGSLLESIRRRIDAGQPVSMPEDAKRFLVTPAEAGSICSLAAALAPQGSALVPAERLLEPRVLLDAGRSIIEAMGFTPLLVSDLGEARRILDLQDGTWPVVVTPLDTPGEKTVEVFRDGTEDVVSSPFQALEAIRPRATSPDEIHSFLEILDAVLGSDKIVAEDERQIWAAMAELVGGFEPVKGRGNLDDRA